MEKLSVVIITLNEEEHLEKCLSSVSNLADQILVLDSFSTDKTQEICAAAGVDFVQHAFDGYISQKNRALAMAKYDLVLSLDGDEALSEQAREEVIQIKSDRVADGYTFKRNNNYCGRWMRHTSLYPDRKLRLFDRRQASWGGYDPHDRIDMVAGSKVIHLSSDIRHWVYANKEEHLLKVDDFAARAARAYFDLGRPAAPWHKVMHAGWRYFDELILRAGFMEGHLGRQFASLSARYTYLKYKKLEKHHAEGS